MEQILSILFYLISSKKDKNGLIPIYIRITLNGRRSELSSHRKIHPSDWDNMACQAKGASEEARILNNYLDSQKAKIYRQFNILESLGKPFTADDLKNRMTGKKVKHHSLIEVFEYHNNQLKQKIGINYAKGTYKNYSSTLSRLKSFLLFQYRKTDIFLMDLKYSFVTNFELYLKTQHSCGQNSAMKHIVRLKKIVNLAMKNEWLDKDPFRNYKASYEEVNRGYLTKEELTRLEEKAFTIPRLEKVRDVFVFCCYTGFAYADVKELTPADITTGIDGEKWIITYRRKTNHRSPVPLLPQALAIIEKYK
jgi:integrase